MKNSYEACNEGGYDDPWRDEDLDYSDDRFKRLEALVKTYGRSADKNHLSPEGGKSISLWLHRWIMIALQTRSASEYVKKGVLGFVYGSEVPRETIDMQRKAARDIFASSKLLTHRLGATSLFTSLGPAFEDAYKQLVRDSEDSVDDVGLYFKDFVERFDNPDWESVRELIFTHMILIQCVANAAIKNLNAVDGKMGQPRKTTRDELFFQWQEKIASDLSLSLDDSIHLASKSWEIYFPEEEIKEDAAAKIIKTQRARVKVK